MELNFVGTKTFKLASEGNSTEEADISGTFFGQSSFASLSIASQRSVINVKDVIRDAEELKLFAPLGCGFQTGSGSIANVADAQEKDAVVILGVGGVGLVALMVSFITS